MSRNTGNRDYSLSQLRWQTSINPPPNTDLDRTHPLGRNPSRQVLIRQDRKALLQLAYQPLIHRLGRLLFGKRQTLDRFEQARHAIGVPNGRQRLAHVEVVDEQRHMLGLVFHEKHAEATEQLEVGKDYAQVGFAEHEEGSSLEGFELWLDLDAGWCWFGEVEAVEINVAFLEGLWICLSSVKHSLRMIHGLWNEKNGFLEQISEGGGFPCSMTKCSNTLSDSLVDQNSSSMRR